ncbi:hypothetical protein ACFPRL_17520 [Pseudoclavibacter helvolus]
MRRDGVVEEHERVSPAREQVTELRRVLPLGHPALLSRECLHRFHEPGQHRPVRTVEQRVDLRVREPQSLLDARCDRRLPHAGSPGNEHSSRRGIQPIWQPGHPSTLRSTEAARRFLTLDGDRP